MSRSNGNTRIALSAIDSRWPEYTATLVRHLDALGYTRYWTTEHHSPRQSASPIVSAAVAATASERLAIGTAGIMIRYYNPLRVAKDAHLLEMLYPNRIDVGTIGGLMLHRPTHHALTSSPFEDEWNRELFVDLARYLRSSDAAAADVVSASVCRSLATTPRLWLCSNKSSSAVFAGQQSAGLIFHLPLAHALGVQRAKEVTAAYRAAFVPSPAMPAPKVAVVCFGCCAETAAEAEKMWPRILVGITSEVDRSIISQDGRSPRPTFFLGDPESCAVHLHQIADEVEADEIIANCMAEFFSDRLTGYSLLARAFGLVSHEPLHLHRDAIPEEREPLATYQGAD